jgi:hypothetical protein
MTLSSSHDLTANVPCVYYVMLYRFDESKSTFRNTASIFRVEELAKQQNSYFTLVSSLDYSSTLKMEVTSSSETLVASKRTIRPHFADDRTRQPRSSLFCFLQARSVRFWGLEISSLHAQKCQTDRHSGTKLYSDTKLRNIYRLRYGENKDISSNV